MFINNSTKPKAEIGKAGDDTLGVRQAKISKALGEIIKLERCRRARRPV